MFSCCCVLCFNMNNEALRKSQKDALKHTQCEFSTFVSVFQNFQKNFSEREIERERERWTNWSVQYACAYLRNLSLYFVDILCVWTVDALKHTHIVIFQRSPQFFKNFKKIL